jgi:energy-coupling factor transport system permease protein
MTGTGVMRTLFYRRLPSPLHAARATVGAAWTFALILAALSSDHPLVLAVLTVAIVLAGACAGVGRELVRSLRTAAIVALPIVVVNVLVSRDGLTVFARLGDLGPFGRGNLTVEALVYGAVIALKVAIIMLATTLASLAVDPDELLRVARRLSFRSALTASLATRMIPVLANDARRLAEAQSTRPTRPTQSMGAGQSMRQGAPRAHARARVRLLSAIVGSSLDRAMDVAATLELRGFAGARRAPRRRVPWSRHDLAFATSAASLAALALAARVGGVATFSAYPQVRAGGATGTLALAAAIAVVVLLPFADRRGVEP